MQSRPADTSTSPTRMTDGGTSGTDPVEGPPDLGIPGADRQDIPTGPQDDLPERLGQRIENGSSSGLAGEPDVLPDVEVPESTM